MKWLLEILKFQACGEEGDWFKDGEMEVPGESLLKSKKIIREIRKTGGEDIKFRQTPIKE